MYLPIMSLEMTSFLHSLLGLSEESSISSSLASRSAKYLFSSSNLDIVLPEVERINLLHF